MEIRIVSFSQGPVTVNVDLWEKSESNRYDFTFLPIIRYSEESDFIGFQLDVRAAANASPILDLGFLIGMEVEGWSEMLKTGLNPEENRSCLHEISKVFWQTAIGAVAAMTAPKISPALILPNIDEVEFAKKIILVNSRHS